MKFYKVCKTNRDREFAREQRREVVKNVIK